MKPLLILILSCFTALSVFAQNNITVNITLNGNYNREVLVDGKPYQLSDYVNTSTNSKNKITVTNLQPGQHTLQVIRNKPNNNRNNVGRKRIFNLRAGYDMDIVVNGNGTAQLTEKRIRNRNRNNVANRTAMTTTNFNYLLQDVRRRSTNSSRVTTITTAFNKSYNYFSISQVSQLLQLVSGDANRVQLLKSSYRTITEPSKFADLYNLLSAQESRDDITAYVNANNNTPGSPNQGNKVAMSNYNYNQLTEDISSQWNDARVTATYNAFSNTANYFTSDQVRRLILLNSGEANMLHLAKASYRSVVDPANFTSVYNMLPSQATRSDLLAYVRSYNPNIMYSGTVGGNTSYRTPMTDASFNTLIDDIRNQWLPGAKKSAVISAFTTGNNYFTSSQARQLIQLDNDEPDRLDMAKASFKTIVDPNNFSMVYDLFNSPSYKEDLAAYVRNYNPNTTYSGSTSTTTKVAMTESSFNLLSNNVRNDWNADTRVNSIYNAFSNNGYFFTTDQAQRLIQMITGEANILHLAKASFRSIVDPDNFATIYNMLPTQTSRNELATYVRNYNPNVMYTGNASQSSTSRTPMSDAAFQSMISDIRVQWLPGAKKSAVINAFTIGNNFFTTSQARQLIQLDNDEPDRLDMAKASYKAIVDPQNFTQVYDLFTTQAYRDNLAAYVSSIR